MSIASLEQVKAMLRSMLGVTDRSIAKVQEDAAKAQELASAARGDVASKMDATNPVGTGSFSMGRLAGSTVGKDSHTEGGGQLRAAIIAMQKDSAYRRLAITATQKATTQLQVAGTAMQRGPIQEQKLHVATQRGAAQPQAVMAAMRRGVPREQLVGTATQRGAAQPQAVIEVTQRGIPQQLRVTISMSKVDITSSTATTNTPTSSEMAPWWTTWSPAPTPTRSIGRAMHGTQVTLREPA